MLLTERQTQKLFTYGEGEIMSSISCSESILRKSLACRRNPKTGILTSVPLETFARAFLEY